ncbi:hypothetical protein ACH5RR_037544 [Cinchona calisaya]|uniref:Uncharacterized protein n=1 Tax=Cinchona calisaya TaxID=153742 RepID=A0ABD2YB91_9GENT
MLAAGQESIDTIAAAQEIFVEANIVESKHQGFAAAGVEETEATSALGFASAAALKCDLVGGVAAQDLVVTTVAAQLDASFKDTVARGGAEVTATAGESPSAVDTTIDKDERPHHAAIAMGKNSAATACRDEKRMAVSAQVSAEAVVAPKVDDEDTVIRLSHCSNPELSSTAIGSKIKPFVAAVMGKNSTATTRVERLDTTTKQAATSATKIAETSDAIATILQRKKAVATAEQPQNTRTGINPIMTHRLSMNSSNKSVNIGQEEIEGLYQFVKNDFVCGSYSSVSYPYDCRDLFTDSERILSASWMILAAEILLLNWRIARRALNY